MTLFTDKAVKYMPLLMKDFGLTDEDAAAIFGNAGAETEGFKYFQEISPTVAGSRGGFGWFQWTGPRRRAFEAYCARNKLDPYSDDANYKFLFVELSGTEKKAVPAVKAAQGLYNKTVAFEKSFERAGVKAYDKRYKYAQEALSAYRAQTPAVKPSTLIVTSTFAGGALAAIVAVLQFFGII
jgi:Phage tail lysozyme